MSYVQGLRRALCLVALLVANTAKADTVFTLTSEATGETQVATDADYSMRINGNRTWINFATSYQGEGAATGPMHSSTWYLNIKAPVGETLHPGLYSDAGCTMPQYGRAIGLELTPENPVCMETNTVYGWVAIRQIEFDDAGKLTRLEAVFNQRLGSPDQPGYTGVLRYNALPLHFRLQTDRRSRLPRVDLDSYGDTSIFTLYGRADEPLGFDASVPQDSWLTMLVPPAGKALAVGRYPLAREADATHAALGLYRQDSAFLACEDLQGALEIKAITVSDAGDVTGLWAHYNARCGRRPALTGEIRYNL